VGNDLMSEKIEIDPGVRATTLVATKDIAIEFASNAQILHGEGDVKGSKNFHAF
ncbi:MAG: hypothetical protein HN996_10420, partial [Opitutae bacterium]|nr:hypothetical protein [Opitutae bacterium]